MINISSMFAKSLFKPLRDHMDKVAESVAPLKYFFDALHQGNYVKVEKIQQKFSLAEEEADLIKNEVRNHLPDNWQENHCACIYMRLFCRTCCSRHSCNCFPNRYSSFNHSNNSGCSDGSRTGPWNRGLGFEDYMRNFHVMGYYTPSWGLLVIFFFFRGVFL